MCERCNICSIICCTTRQCTCLPINKRAQGRAKKKLLELEQCPHRLLRSVTLVPGASKFSHQIFPVQCMVTRVTSCVTCDVTCDGGRDCCLTPQIIDRPPSKQIDLRQSILDPGYLFIVIPNKSLNLFGLTLKEGLGSDG